MSKANPVYFIYLLSDKANASRYLIASWNWYRRYLAQDLPERWEIVDSAQLAHSEKRYKQAGYRLFCPLNIRKEAVYQQILSSLKEPRRTPKQQAKYEARQARLQQEALLEAQKQQGLEQQYYQFLDLFRGLDKPRRQKAYRQLARQHHPDAGGSDEMFHVLESAYRQALKY